MIEKVTKEEMFKKINCILCGDSEEGLLREEKKGNDFFRIVRCKKCGLVFTNPQPFPEWIRDSHSRNLKLGFYTYEGVKEYHSHYINGLEIIKKYFKRGKLLDVGCGVGYFLWMTKSNRFVSLGIDFSPLAAKVAKEKFGLSICVGELEDVGFNPDSFDIVTLWNVIEHFYDPVKEISLIHKLLKDKGILLIETPNILLRSILLKFTLTKMILKLFHRDTSLIPWEHLFYWTPITLKRILLKEGFREIKFYPVNAPIETPLYNFIQLMKKILFIVSNGKMNLYFPIVAIAIK